MKQKTIAVSLLVCIVAAITVSFKNPKKSEPKEAESEASRRGTTFCTELPPDNFSFLPDSIRDLRFFSTPSALASASPTSVANYMKLLKLFGKEEHTIHDLRDERLRWRKNTLIVTFYEGGHDVQRRRVMQTVKQWEACCKVRFVFMQVMNADICISFEGGVNESYIGTESRKHRASMWLNVAADAPDAEYNRVVLHEFGHAMGFVHEHQVEDGNPLIWDTAKVVAYYLAPPNKWDSLKTLDQVIRRYATTTVRGTKYDAKSIMCYEIPAGLVKGNKYIIPANTTLSDSDKYYAASIYK